MPNLDGRLALVAGASKGLGAAIARRLATDGADVIAVARSGDALRALADEIASTGGTARAVAADLTRLDDLGALCAGLGPVDILVNCAAGDEPPCPITVRNDQHWRSSFELSLFAPLALMGELTPGMVERGRGAIVNVSSIAGDMASAYLGPYCATKAALNMITRVAAMELAPHGVRCNAIAPGITAAGKTYEMVPQSIIDEPARLIPAGRLGDPEEIAAAVSWLCSDEASYVTGTVLTVDGGATAGNWAAIAASGR